MINRKRSLALILILIATAASAEWLDFNRGLSKSLKQGKPMVIDFYTDWCHWCKVMDEKTFAEDNVKAYLEKHFVTVRVHAEDKSQSVTFRGETYSNVDFTRAMGVTGFPTLVFIDKNGEPITKLPGYVPAAEFLSVLKYIHGECYQKQMTFAEFLEKQEDCE